MKLKIYTDGGARGNPGLAAIGVVVCNEAGEVILEHQDVIGEATNNIAEYCAMIAGLELAKRLKSEDVECYSDSKLIVNQLNGNFKIKTAHIRKLHERACSIANSIKQVSYHHLPRETSEIQSADRLVNAALDLKGP